MIKIKPFEMIDLLNFKQNGHFFLENLGTTLEENLKDPRMRMMSMRDDGKNVTVGIFGFNTLRKGVREAFLIPNRDLNKYSKSVLDTLRWILEERNMRYFDPSIFRVEINVKTAEAKWAKALGFDLEGTTKRYDGVTDHLRYVRFY